MASKKNKTKKPVDWFYVYRAINATREQVYHGESKAPKKRKDGSHCAGGTKALKSWNCEADTIRWSKISKHKTQSTASSIAHALEKVYKHPKGYVNIQTAGK